MPRIAVPFGWKRLYYRTEGRFVGIGWAYTYSPGSGGYKRTIILDHELKDGPPIELQISRLARTFRMNPAEPDFRPYRY